MSIFFPTWFAGDTSTAPGTLYHYTSGAALRRILADGVLKPHRATPAELVPSLWFSTNPIWEASAGRLDALGRPLTFEQMCSRSGGLARLCGDAAAAPLSLKELRRLIGPAMQLGISGGRRIIAPAGSPLLDKFFKANEGRWFGTTKAVGRDHWLAVEVAPNRL
jgi:hypothetical protein